jgi:hypothetical protein
LQDRQRECENLLTTDSKKKLTYLEQAVKELSKDEKSQQVLEEVIVAQMKTSEAKEKCLRKKSHQKGDAQAAH